MDETLELLKKLMACEAISEKVENVNAAMEVMASYLRSKNVCCKIENINGRHALYASTTPGKQQDVLLNVHLDVVPPSVPGQFTLTHHDGLYWGRGVHDDQGPAICVAQVLAHYAGKPGLSAIFTADEEIGGATTEAMVDLGYVPKRLGIVVDGPACCVAAAQKGILVLKLTAHGKGGHSSKPWNFDNPIDMLIDGYRRLKRDWRVKASAYDAWHNTMAPCVIEGGFVENQIPDTASMVINFRYTKPEDYDKLIEMVRKKTGLEVTVSRSCPPVVTKEENPLLQGLLKTLKKHYPNMNPRFVRMNGATDARHLIKCNVPIAITGLPGEGPHSANEGLEEDAIEKYRALLIDFLDTFCFA